MTGLSWWLASDGELRKYRPVPLLLGRKFEHGIMDCYTLFRDAYHLCGIDLPDFGRTNGWWLRGRISIWQHAANGFYQVSMQDAQPGDVIHQAAIPRRRPMPLNDSPS
jgi:cell wall-associated NlpC family hydrolase